MKTKQSKHTQLRIWRSTLKLLHFLHAETGQSLVWLIDDMAKERLESIRGDSEKRNLQNN